MNKLILLAITLLMFALLWSCDNTHTKQNSTIKKPSIKLETFIDTFLAQNKNWDQNDIIKDQTNKKFKIQIEKAIEQGILEDFPLILGEINEYSNGKFAANFKGHYAKNNVDYNSVLSNLNFDIIGLIDKKNISDLKEDRAYLVKGRFKKFLQSNYRDYLKGMVYTDFIGLTNNGYQIETNIGIILIDVEQITETVKL